MQKSGVRVSVWEGWDQTWGLRGDSRGCPVLGTASPGGSMGAGVLGCPFVTEALCDTGAVLCPEATVTSGVFEAQRPGATAQESLSQEAAAA